MHHPAAESENVLAPLVVVVVTLAASVRSGRIGTIVRSELSGLDCLCVCVCGGSFLCVEVPWRNARGDEGGGDRGWVNGFRERWWVGWMDDEGRATGN